MLKMTQEALNVFLLPFPQPPVHWLLLLRVEIGKMWRFSLSLSKRKPSIVATPRMPGTLVALGPQVSNVGHSGIAFEQPSRIF
jgi:hypothetical protein